MKRAIKLHGGDQELIISTHTVIKDGGSFLWLEEMPDKTWRITYSKGLFTDLTQVKEFRFVTEILEKTAKGKKPTIPQKVEIVSLDNHVLETWNINSSVAIDNNAASRIIAFSFNKRTNTWRLRYYTSLIPDIAACTGFTIVRED